MHSYNANGQEIPIKIIRERRRSIRVYIGKKEIIIRLPKQMSKEREQEQMTKVKAWLDKQFAKAPALTQRYQNADYQSGDILRVGQRQYEIQIREAARKTSKAQLKDGVITLVLSDQLSATDRSDAIKTLLSRVIGADQLPAITQRVYELNDQYFKRPLQSVKLKYNHSNWGSCSSLDNINFSTRLLFAPPDVIDYVIIHELAHLIEHNHSDRFWALVEGAMPNYKEKEKWLAKYGSQCDF